MTNKNEEIIEEVFNKVMENNFRFCSYNEKREKAIKETISLTLEAQQKKTDDEIKLSFIEGKGVQRTKDLSEFINLKQQLSEKDKEFLEKIEEFVYSELISPLETRSRNAFDMFDEIVKDMWEDDKIVNFTCENKVVDTRDNKSCKYIMNYYLKLGYYPSYQISNFYCEGNTISDSFDTAGCKECAKDGWISYYLENCEVIK
ncbi:MAG: hypothetical protein IMZ60_00420 [Actinobacteria bacterium]|nr:hypothetical protein [Actinomycetota bacterium]